MRIDVVIDASRCARQAAASYAAPRFPALERIAARGETLSIAAADIDGCLRALFGVAAGETIPYAAWALLGEGEEPGEHYWLRLDPAHLRPERMRLRLIALPDGDVTRAEASALASAIAPHLQAEGHVLLPLHPQRWYLRSAVELDAGLGPPERHAGWLEETALPSGPHGAYWRRLITESQMLLHELPVNEAREAAGKLAVNAVWPWGGGRMRTLGEKPYARVLSESVLARGMALASGADAALPPANAGALGAQPGDVLLTLQADTVEGLESVARDWIPALTEALAQGRAEQLRLYLLAPAGGMGWRATHRHLRRWWRRSRPLRFHA